MGDQFWFGAFFALLVQINVPYYHKAEKKLKVKGYQKAEKKFVKVNDCSRKLSGIKRD